MEQSEIDEYALEMAPRLSVESHAMLTVASLLGMKKLKDGTITDPDDAIVGGLLVIHGNSLVGAHYREISGSDFGRDMYYIFPVYKSKMHLTIQKLAGKNTKVLFPEYNKNKLQACIFYGSGYSVVEIPEDKTVEGMDALAALIGKKLAAVPEGPVLMEMFSDLFKENQNEDY